jgi:hypothetical protein
MAGTIEVGDGVRWSAASWMFDWVVEFLADNVAEPALGEGLREIVDENLGWLGLPDFGEEAEVELRTLLRRRLIDEADRTFSSTMANRQEALDHLRELVGLLG